MLVQLSEALMSDNDDAKAAAQPLAPSCGVERRSPCSVLLARAFNDALAAELRAASCG